MKTEHKYAQVLRWIAGGEDLELINSSGKYTPVYKSMALMHIAKNEFHPSAFRIKPNTIMIGDVECEAPVLQPENKQKLWWYDTETLLPAVIFYETHDLNQENTALFGLFFASKEACLAAHNAITKLLTQSK